MAYERRDIRGGAVATTLSSGINSGDTSFSIAASTGWPDGGVGDFFVVIDRGNSNEEKIRCATRSSLTCNVQTAGRAADGTSAVAHASGATVEHCITALDEDEANLAVTKTVGKVTTAGDFLVADAANSFVRLANGTTGLPLVAGASTPAYTALGTSGIADDAITSAKILADAVGASEIAASAVGTSEIADAAVTTAKLLDLGTTTAKINDLAVTTGKIAAGAVTSAKLDSGVVDDSTLQFNSGVLRVKDAGITIAKLASGLQPIRTATTTPSSPVAGQIWFDTDDFLLHVYNGTDWVCITTKSATVATSQGTTSTSYTNLTTAGPTVTITTGTKAKVTVGCNLTNNTVSDGAAMSFQLDASGATTVAASDLNAVYCNAVTSGQNFTYSYESLVTGLTAGSNVFKAQYRAVAGGTATFSQRWISVVGIP